VTRTKHEVGEAELSQPVVESLPHTNHPLHGLEDSVIVGRHPASAAVQQLAVQLAMKEVPDRLYVVP